MSYKFKWIHSILSQFRDTIFIVFFLSCFMNCEQKSQSKHHTILLDRQWIIKHLVPIWKYANRLVFENKLWMLMKKHWPFRITCCVVGDSTIWMIDSIICDEVNNVIQWLLIISCFFFLNCAKGDRILSVQILIT